MSQHDTLTLEQIARDACKHIDDEWYAQAEQCALNALHTFAEQFSATQPAQAAQPVSRDVIRDVFLRNGFTIKDGCSDLKPYVYAAANALLEVAAAQPVQGVPQGWRIQWAPDLEPEEILVTAPNCEPGGMTLARNHANLAYRMLYALCRSLLTATPTPPHADQKGQ